MKKLLAFIFLACSVAFGVEVMFYGNTDTYKSITNNIEVVIEPQESSVNKITIKENDKTFLQGNAVYGAKNKSYLYEKKSKNSLVFFDKRCSFEIILEEKFDVCGYAISRELEQGYDPTKYLIIRNIQNCGELENKVRDSDVFYNLIKIDKEQDK